MHTDNKRELVYLIPLLVVCIVYSVRAYTLPIGDFGNYWFGSYFLHTGQWSSKIYDPAAFNLSIYALGYRDFFLSYKAVPPFSALLYFPFSFGSPYVSKVIWNLFSVFLFLFSVIRITPPGPNRKYVYLLIPLVFWFPLRNTLSEGQSYLFLFFLLAEGWVNYRNGKLFVAAFLWALAIHLKISPLIVFAFLLAERNVKAILILALATLFFIVISLPFTGLDTWTDYMFNILPRLSAGEINNPYAINYQSLQVLLKTILVPDALLNPNAPFNDYSLCIKLTRVWTIAVLFFMFAPVSEGHSAFSRFSAWMLASLLVSGYGNSFSLILLLFPLLSFVEAYSIGKKVFVALTIVLLACWLPLNLFGSMSIPFRFPRLFLLTGLFVWSVALSSRFNMKLLILPMLLYAVFLMPVKDRIETGNYLLNREEKLLIYDYRFYQDTLIYDYFDRNGPGIGRLPLDFKISTADRKEIFEFSRRKGIGIIKTSLINDSLVFFLSDENRGAGFFTLRTYNLNPSGKFNRFAE